jgi:hypothetical protein
MTSARTWLRISAIVTLLFAIGHSMGGLHNWAPGSGSGSFVHAIGAMHFEAEGVTRSLLDFYRGFGIALSIFLAMESILLWELGAVAAERPDIAMRITRWIAAAAVVNAVVIWAFILPVPGAFAGAQAACLIAAVGYLRVARVDNTTTQPEAVARAPRGEGR